MLIYRRMSTSSSNQPDEGSTPVAVLNPVGKPLQNKLKEENVSRDGDMDIEADKLEAAKELVQRKLKVTRDVGALTVNILGKQLLRNLICYKSEEHHYWQHISQEGVGSVATSTLLPWVQASELQTLFGDVLGTAKVDELREAAKHLYKQPQKLDFHVVYNALEYTIERIKSALPLIVSLQLADLDPKISPQVCFGRKLLLNWQQFCTAWLGEWRLLLLFHALSKKLFLKFNIRSEQYGDSPELASAMRRAFQFQSNHTVRQFDDAYAESQKHGPHFAADSIDVHTICHMFERGNNLGLYSAALLEQYSFVVPLLTQEDKLSQVLQRRRGVAR